MHMWSALFLLSLNCIPAYILHTYTFPNIPYTAGVYHIHSPVHFMETHGFALPGFRITETCTPQWMGGYVVTEFNFTTHFGGHMSAKVFSGLLHASGDTPSGVGPLCTDYDYRKGITQSKPRERL